MVILPVLAACAPTPEPQLTDEAERIIARDAAGAAAQPLGNTYPSVREVPPRPQLNYTPAQRRQIQDGLVADLEHARRTAELVRSTEGASPPPMPPVPEITPAEDAGPARAAAPRKAPSRVMLIERRDTSNDLSNFLDNVMASDMQVGAIEPSLVPQPRGTGGNLEAGDAGIVADPGAGGGIGASVSGIFGDDVTAAAGTAGVPGPLPVGRRWLFPLAAAELMPTAEALQPMLAELVGQGALAERRVAVAGRSADALQARRRAVAMAELLQRQGIPAERIELRQDTSSAGEAVGVQVLDEAGQGAAPQG